MPGLWYLAHLAAPDLAVAGATIPGVPFVVLGRNRDVAWGFTNTGSDTQDLFIERVVDGDPGRYLVPGGTAPFGDAARPSPYVARHQCSSWSARPGTAP